MEPYRYFTRIENVRREFFPLNVRALKLEYRYNEEERRHAFVETFSGDLTIDNRSGDYDFFYGLEQAAQRCRAIPMEIEKRGCSNDYSIWKYGKIRLVDASFDLDNCSMTIKPLIDNEYTCFDNNKDKELNLFDLPLPRITTQYLKGTIEKLQYDATDYWTAGFDDPARFGGVDPASIGWKCYKYIRHTATLPPTYTFYYAREVFTSATNPGPEWISLGGSNWARLPLLIYDWQNTADLSPAFGDQYGLNFTVFGDTDTGAFSNGMFLNDILENLISSYCGLTVQSNFLQLNPTGSFADTYPLFEEGLTYNDVVYQKSDVKRPNDSNKATINTYTLKKILLDACNAYNLQWRIEPGVFRLEHVSFFTRSLTLDTTTDDRKKQVIRTRRYSYKADKLPRYETFKFMEDGSKDFVGMPIEYPGDCASDDEGSREVATNIDTVTTDVELCLQNAPSNSSKVSDEGIVIMATKLDATDGKYYLFTVAPTLDSTRHLNNALGWSYLLKTYYRHERLQLNGYLNGDYVTFLTTKPTKKRVRIGIRFCCDDAVDLNGIVRTNLGDAVIDASSFGMYQDELELDLVYPDTTGNDACLKLKKFIFHHFDNSTDAFYFETQFFTAGTFITEIEAIKPDLSKQSFIYNPDSAGIYPATFDPFLPGLYRFRKRIICGIGYTGPWSDYISVNTVDNPSITCEAVTATYLRRVASNFVFRFSTIDVPAQAEVSRPGPVTPYLVNGSDSLNSSALPRTDKAFNINAAVPYSPTAPVSPGTYRFRFRRICNAATGLYSPWSDYVDVTV